jgi:hypothetical protein
MLRSNNNHWRRRSAPLSLPKEQVASLGGIRSANPTGTGSFTGNGAGGCMGPACARRRRSLEMSTVLEIKILQRNSHHTPRKCCIWC